MNTEAKPMWWFAGGGQPASSPLEALNAPDGADRGRPRRAWSASAAWRFNRPSAHGPGGHAPLQARMKIPDTPEIAAARLAASVSWTGDTWPMQWARYYVEHSRQRGVYDRLTAEGVKFMPAVNWVGARPPRRRQQPAALSHRLGHVARTHAPHDRGMQHAADSGGRLTVLHATASARSIMPAASSPAHRHRRTRGAELRLRAPVVVLAMGGINGSHDRRAPTGRPIARGPPACSTARTLRRRPPAPLGGRRMPARRSHAGEMWNYAAGFPHPFPRFEGHGLSTIPCKSALWLDHSGGASVPSRW